MLRNLFRHLGARRASASELLARGERLAEAGDAHAAIEAYRQALTRDASCLKAYNALGIALQQNGQFAEAAHVFQLGLALAPEELGLLNNLGTALRMAGDLDGASIQYEIAARHSPDDPLTQLNRAMLAQKLGLADDAVRELRRLVRERTGDKLAWLGLAQALNYSSEYDRAGILDEFCAAGDVLSNDASAAPPPRPHGRTTRSGPLRIGYLSPDFNDHPVARFMEPILSNHDPAAVTVTCYDDTARTDAVTARLRELGVTWRRVAGLPDGALAAMIAADSLDILVDLAGLTTGSRPGVLARRPAPVQASYLGYLNTTGLRAVDWRISDRTMDPPGSAQQYYVERLAYLPACQWLFTPPTFSTECGPLPADERGFVTFGAAHNFAKVNPQVLALWAEVVAGVPGSRIELSGVPRGAAHKRVQDTFAAHGVASDRVHCVERMPRAAYYGFLAALDIALDAFPYNGGTTTAEALWMGVPVVSLAGRHGSARSGASLLAAVGLDELVAQTPRDYVEICVRLCGDRERLAQLRSGLRERMLRSSLMDPRGFVRALEALYRSMLVAPSLRES